MKARIGIYGLIGMCVMAIIGCRIEIKPLQSTLDKLEAKKKSAAQNPDVVYRFFDEQFYANGYEWHYPDESKVYIDQEGSGKNGEVAIRMDLVAADYSGGAVELWNVTYNLEPYFHRGALQFWCKGAIGGEVAYVTLADEDGTDGFQTGFRLPLDKYGGISTEWKHFSIPLADFGRRGLYWDEKKQVEVPHPVAWDKICIFELTIEKGNNKQFTVWIDDIYIVKDVFEPAPERDEEYWDDRKETISLPPVAERPAVNILHTLFDNELTGGKSGSVYGGKTAFKTQPTTDVNKNSAVLALYMDNADYSGVNINFGKPVDLSAARKTKAGLAFWAKFGPDVGQVFVGLVDDNSDKKMVQTNAVLADYAALDTNWRYFMIPLKEFGSQGNWWDEDKAIEVPGTMEWNKIIEICFTADKYGNRLQDGVPVAVYIDDIAIIEEVPGYVDPDEYWNAFTSNEPDMTVFDLEEPQQEMWETVSGEESNAFFKIMDQEDREQRATFGKKMLQIGYANKDWCYVAYPFAKNNTAAQLRDWTKHRALEFMFHTEKEEETIRIQINDSGKEAFTANATGKKGWNTLTVPLKNFKKYPYYQEPDAELNNKLDLNTVTQISFWPTTAGSGIVMVDNVKLTNRQDKQ